MNNCGIWKIKCNRVLYHKYEELLDQSLENYKGWDGSVVVSMEEDRHLKRVNDLLDKWPRGRPRKS